MSVFPLASEDDLIAARAAVRSLAMQQGFSAVDLARIVTAASELARNVCVHAGRGTMQLESVCSAARFGVRIVVRDDGPGIADIDQAMQDGWSSGQGLGKGLPGSRRLVDEFEIESAPGRGTTVTVTKWSGRGDR